MPGHSGKLPPQPEFTSEAPVVIVPPPQPAAPAPAEPTPAAEASTENSESPVSEAEPSIAVEVVPTVAPVEPPVAAVEVSEQPLVEQPEVESAPVEHSITVAPTADDAAAQASAPNSSLALPDQVDPVETTSTLEAMTREAPPVGETPYEAEAPAVNVNLGELNARIEGYNQQLADIEASMVVDEALSGSRLTKLVDAIEQLAGQYQFVKLYYDSLTVAERQRVAEPRSMSEAIARCMSCVFADSFSASS